MGALAAAARLLELARCWASCSLRAAAAASQPGTGDASCATAQHIQPARTAPLGSMGLPFLVAEVLPAAVSGFEILALTPHALVPGRLAVLFHFACGLVGVAAAGAGSVKACWSWQEKTERMGTVEESG